MEYPHPGGRRQLAPAMDMVARYEQQSGRQLRREPAWRAQRDALHGQPARQAARAAAVRVLWGSVALAWTDVLVRRGRSRFIPSFLLFLRFQ